ncbi:MAG: transcriptional repressor LexA [Clostridia bacterium]
MRKIDAAYEYIRDYITKNEYPPTIREIGDAINVKSTSTVAYYLRKLEESNKIVKGSYKNRSIQLMENMATTFNSTDLINIPYIESLEEGKPLMSQQNIKNRYMLSGGVFKGIDMFVIPVKDNAMKSSHIMKGDKVIVSRQNVGKNGEIIVAMIGSSYVIARVFKEFSMYKLQFDNADFQPVYAEKLTILGKVVGVIRNEII